MLTAFEMIKVAGDFNVSKERLLRVLSKPRMKKWWEKLMDREFDHFYS